MKNPKLFNAERSYIALDHMDTREGSCRKRMNPVIDAIEDAKSADDLAARLNALDDNYQVHDWHVDRETSEYVRLEGSHTGFLYYLQCEKEVPPAAAPVMQSTVSTLPTFVQVPRYDGIIRDDKIVFEQKGKPAFINVNFVSSILPYTSRNYKVPEGYFTIRMNDGMTYETDQATADFILSLC